VRVVQPRLAGPHRVLVAAEQRQALGDEKPAGLQRLAACHRPGEAVQPAGVIREAVLTSAITSRVSIGFETGARWHGA
jgi:hypothetical protein